MTQLAEEPRHLGRCLAHPLPLHGVVHPVPPLVPVHQPGFSEHPQVLRDGGMGDAEPLRERPDAQVTVGEERQNLHARWVGQRFKHSDQVIHGATV
jgi:hypothetical protein